MTARLFLFLLSIPFLAIAADDNNINWHNRSYVPKKFTGISTEEAYQKLLQGKTSKKVVVAVIDSGTDIEHEDLKDKIWINQDEIEGNGIDDDGNGYIDDTHGWNFLGASNGEMVNYENYEITRMYRDAKFRFDSLGEGEEDYKKYKKLFQDQLESSRADSVATIGFVNKYTEYDSILKAHLGEEYSREELKALNPENDTLKKAKRFMNLLHLIKVERSYIEEIQAYIATTYNYNLNVHFNAREVIGDDPSDINDVSYGNPNVVGDVADHGTHVAGIIGAKRNNELGLNGVAENVELMILRAVPYGDESDKDIALAIRYAVDNGAQIINMSFGKKHSPYKEMVQEAIQYAASKNVLLIHAAGNDAANIDEITFHPKHAFDGYTADNWINVGALDQKIGKNVCASFTNYGQTLVDIYAPGVQIYSTVPGSKYEFMDGTSMASPVVSGVAALVLSYYPELTAKELKTILIDSAHDLGKLKVKIPGGGKKSKKVRFETLSTSGKIINVYKALELAETRNSLK